MCVRLEGPFCFPTGDSIIQHLGMGGISVGKAKKIKKHSKESGKRIDWEQILPPEPRVYWRHRWNVYRDTLGLPFSRGHLQNLDCKGEGPERVELNGRVAYLRDDLVRWLNRIGGVEEGVR